MHRPRPCRGLRVVASGSSFPKVGLHQCPSEKNGQRSAGSQPARPFSRPHASADCRKNAGLSAYSPGVHCRDRLRAGGSRIRTLGPRYTQKTDGGSHLVLRLRQRRPDVVRRGPPLPKSSNYLPREFGMTVRPNHLAANPTIDSDRVPAST